MTLKILLIDLVKSQDAAIWLPAYTFSELRGQLIRLKSGLSADPVFRKIVQKAYEIQRIDVKKRNKRIGKFQIINR